MEKFAGFDIDGTLAGCPPADTSGYREYYIFKLAEYLNRNGRFNRGYFNAMLKDFEQYSKDRNYGTFAVNCINHFASGIRGKKQDDVIRIGKNYLQKNREEIYTHSAEIVRYCNENGFLTIGISASPLNEIIDPFCNDIGIKEAIGTTFKTERGRYTGETDRTYAGKFSKLEALFGFFTDGNYELAENFLGNSSFFGNSFRGDYTVLCAVGHPFPTNPDSKLKRMAKIHEWPILDLHDGNILSTVKSKLEGK